MISSTDESIRTSVCKHCGRKITHVTGKLWIDSTEVHEAYCMMDPIHGSRLHEPTYNLASLTLKRMEGDSNA